MKVLVVVDMQNDFIDGALGTPEATAIVDNVARKIAGHEGPVIFTRDTHGADYRMTQEGRNLAIEHCIKGSKGWEISSKLPVADDTKIIDKPTFGSKELALYLESLNEKEKIDEIEVIGVCTEICVISNVLLIKAFLPEVPISVDPSCCAGIMPENHEYALAVMKMCQVTVE